MNISDHDDLDPASRLPIRILAIDPSVTQTGLAFPDQSTMVVCPPGALRGAHRLVWLRDYVAEVLYDLKPDLVVVEDYALGKHGGAVIPTVEWGGVLRIMLHEWPDLPWVVCPPQVIKSYCTGKGNSAKSQVQSEISARTGVVFKNHDESDAWGLAAAANDHYGQPWLKVPAEWRKKALDQVEWPNLNGGNNV